MCTEADAAILSATIERQRERIAQLEADYRRASDDLARAGNASALFEADAAALAKALIEWYDADGTPGFPAAEAALVALCQRIKAADHPGATLLAEQAAARALGDHLSAWVARYGRCWCCGFGSDISGKEFHGSECTLAAYQAALSRGHGPSLSAPPDTPRSLRSRSVASPLRCGRRGRRGSDTP